MSEARIAANRANAQRSTGPRTPEGKRASSRNAVRHGLLAREPVLGDEDRGLFEVFWEEVRTGLDPVGGLETALTDRVAGLLWRLQRLGIIEAGLLMKHTADVVATRAKSDLAQRARPTPLVPRLRGALRAAGQAEAPAMTFSKLTPEERQRAEERLQAAEAERRRPEVAVAEGFMRAVDETDYLGLLARYESSLGRELDRTLERLERLQAARLGPR